MSSKRLPGDQAGRPSSRTLSPPFLVQPTVAQSAAVYDRGELVSPVGQKSEPPAGTAAGHILPGIFEKAKAKAEEERSAAAAAKEKKEQARRARTTDGTDVLGGELTNIGAVRRRLHGSMPRNDTGDASQRVLEKARNARNLTSRHLHELDRAFEEEDAAYAGFRQTMMDRNKPPRVRTFTEDELVTEAPSEKRAAAAAARRDQLSYAGGRETPSRHSQTFPVSRSPPPGARSAPTQPRRGPSPLRHTVGGPSPARGSSPPPPRVTTPPPTLPPIHRHSRAGSVPALHSADSDSADEAAPTFSLEPGALMSVHTMVGSSTTAPPSPESAIGAAGKMRATAAAGKWLKKGKKKGTNQAEIDALIRAAPSAGHFSSDSTAGTLVPSATLPGVGFGSITDDVMEKQSSGEKTAVIDALEEDASAAQHEDGDESPHSARSGTGPKAFVVEESEVELLSPTRAQARAAGDAGTSTASPNVQARRRFEAAQQLIATASLAPQIPEQGGTLEESPSAGLPGFQPMDAARDIAVSPSGCAFFAIDVAEEDPVAPLPSVEANHWRDIADLHLPKEKSDKPKRRGPPPFPAHLQHLELKPTSVTNERAAQPETPRAKEKPRAPQPVLLSAGDVEQEAEAGLQALAARDFNAAFQALLAQPSLTAEGARQWGLAFESVLNDFAAAVVPVVRCLVMERFTTCVQAQWPTEWPSGTTLPHEMEHSRSGGSTPPSGRMSLATIPESRGASMAYSHTQPSGYWHGSLGVKPINPTTVAVGDSVLIELSVEADAPRDAFGPDPGAAAHPLASFMERRKAISAASRGIQAVMKAGSTTLHVPLGLCVDFMGVQTWATARLPLGEGFIPTAATLRYGRFSPATQVVADDDDARIGAARVSAALNLAPQRVPQDPTDAGGPIVELCTAPAAQVHRSSEDGRLYMLNSFGIMPGDPDAVRPHGAGLSNPHRLRVEHVVSAPNAVTPDAAPSDEMLRSAMEALRHETIPGLARDLPAFFAYADPKAPFNVKSVLHSHGLNLRYLGALLDAYLDNSRTVAGAVPEPKIVTHLVVEMCARAFASLARFEISSLVQRLTKLPLPPHPKPAGDSHEASMESSQMGRSAQVRRKGTMSPRTPGSLNFSKYRAGKKGKKDEPDAPPPPPPPPPPPAPCARTLYTAMSQLLVHLFNLLLSGSQQARTFWNRSLRPVVELKFPCSPDTLERIQSLAAKATMRIEGVDAAYFHALLWDRASAILGASWHNTPLRDAALRAELGGGNDDSIGAASPFGAAPVAPVSRRAVATIAMLKGVAPVAKHYTPPTFCKVRALEQAGDREAAEALYHEETNFRSLAVGETTALVPLLEGCAALYAHWPEREAEELNLRRRIVLIHQRRFQADADNAPAYVTALNALAHVLVQRMELDQATHALQTACTVETAARRQKSPSDVTDAEAGDFLELRVGGVKSRLLLGDSLRFQGSLRVAEMQYAAATTLARQLFDGRVGAAVGHLLQQEAMKRTIALLYADVLQSHALILTDMGRPADARDVTSKAVRAVLSTYVNGSTPATLRALTALDSRRMPAKQAEADIGILHKLLTPSKRDERASALAGVILRYVSSRLEGQVYLGNVHVGLSTARKAVSALEMVAAKRGCCPVAVRGNIQAVAPLLFRHGDVKGARQLVERALVTARQMAEDAQALKPGARERPHQAQLLVVECFLALCEHTIRPEAELLRHAPQNVRGFGDDGPLIGTGKSGPRYQAVAKGAAEAMALLHLCYDGIDPASGITPDRTSKVAASPLYAHAATLSAEALILGAQCTLLPAALLHTNFMDMLLRSTPQTSPHFVDETDDMNNPAVAQVPAAHAAAELARARNFAVAAVFAHVAAGDNASRLFVRALRASAWMRLSPLRDAVALAPRMAQRQREVAERLQNPPPTKLAEPASVMATVFMIHDAVHAALNQEEAPAPVTVAQAKERATALLRESQEELFRGLAASDQCNSTTLTDFSTTGILTSTFALQSALGLPGSAMASNASDASVLSREGSHRHAAATLQLALLLRSHGEFSAAGVAALRSTVLFRDAYPHAAEFNPSSFELFPLLEALGHTTSAGRIGEATAAVLRVLEREQLKLQRTHTTMAERRALSPESAATATPNVPSRAPTESAESSGEFRERAQRLQAALAQLALYIRVERAAGVVSALPGILADYAYIYPDGANAAFPQSIQAHNSIVRAMRSACRLLDLPPDTLDALSGTAKPETPAEGKPGVRSLTNMKRLREVVRTTFGGSNAKAQAAEILPGGEAKPSTNIMTAFANAAMPDASRTGVAAALAASDLAARFELVVASAKAKLRSLDSIDPQGFSSFATAQES